MLIYVSTRINNNYINNCTLVAFTPTGIAEIAKLHCVLMNNFRLINS